MVTILAGESWLDGWPFWLRLAAFLLGAPVVVVATLLIINYICGYTDEDAS